MPNLVIKRMSKIVTILTNNMWIYNLEVVLYKAYWNKGTPTWKKRKNYLILYLKLL